ncbi:ABC-type sugar transport system ATPase subunit [Thermocatellispora tengchongensis]|uniref:ABC-type sugar transport system ATPase subunit n=1 Tax=Thermocatellispora tengchongensis TaxID=1073253 RepID=A0A840P980_9ACTN|nr:ATP-binding cassette domain-containing protein [Thermocatellispora tengchongensis]MBB5134401.1 ABC-type sugar transport system ATPase subunit [Thermocatellispora tengchongensis]
MTTGASDPGAYAVRVRGVRKRYGHVEALRGVDLDIAPGEVHALLGDNGAGKSTLVKVLAGAVTPDEGSIEIGGRRHRFTSPRDAQRAGIETVYQDLALAPTLPPDANLFLGREPARPGLLGRLGFVDRKAMREAAGTHLRSLNSKVQDLGAEVGSMSGGQKQAVAVARAAMWGSALIMMDEPTAALGVAQTESVLDLIRRIRDEKGLPVLLISHNLPDVFSVADRVTVLRLGRRVLTAPIGEVTATGLIEAMTGADTLRGAS